jgi:hypothetical protein
MRDGDLELRRFSPLTPGHRGAPRRARGQALVARRLLRAQRNSRGVVEVGGELAGGVEYVEEPYEWYPSVALDSALTTALYGRLRPPHIPARERGDCACAMP